MIGRREFATTGLSVGALAAIAGVARGQAPAAAVDHTEHDDMLQACAKACSDCQRACDMCTTHCAHQVHAGKAEHMTTLATCQDCADFCVAAAQIVARGGPFSAGICAACGAACAMCAKECEKFPEDQHMKMCAAECRKCEKACRDMVKHVGAAQQ